MCKLPQYEAKFQSDYFGMTYGVTKKVTSASSWQEIYSSDRGKSVASLPWHISKSINRRLLNCHTVWPLRKWWTNLFKFRILSYLDSCAAY